MITATIKKKRTTVEPITFQEALKRTRNEKRHLLIGNGFSISLFPKIFSYNSLLETADFSECPEARKAFDALKTTDFEVVILALRQSVALLPLYKGGRQATEHMQEHVEMLKELLVKAIAGNHPERPLGIKENEYLACRRFLKRFIGKNRKERNLLGHVYTLNYDLLLYWTLLHEQELEESNEKELICDDGFRVPDEDPGAEFVTWDGEGNNTQNIHYLHGALHLFDNGPDLEKCCWERSGGIPLVNQIRAALDNGKYPLFVSEGDSNSKLTRIRHSGYLQRSLKSFSHIGCNLFIFGHSLAANDEHVLKKIEKGRMKQLFVSLYGDPGSDSNQYIIQRAKRLQLARSPRNPLEVEFFDATSANVWGTA